MWGWPELQWNNTLWKKEEEEVRLYFNIRNLLVAQHILVSHIQHMRMVWDVQHIYLREPKVFHMFTGYWCSLDTAHDTCVDVHCHDIPVHVQFAEIHCNVYLVMTYLIMFSLLRYLVLCTLPCIVMMRHIEHFILKYKFDSRLLDDVWTFHLEI